MTPGMEDLLPPPPKKNAGEELLPPPPKKKIDSGTGDGGGINLPFFGTVKTPTPTEPLPATTEDNEAANIQAAATIGTFKRRGKLPEAVKESGGITVVTTPEELFSTADKEQLQELLKKNNLTPFGYNPINEIKRSAGVQESLITPEPAAEPYVAEMADASKLEQELSKQVAQKRAQLSKDMFKSDAKTITKTEKELQEVENELSLTQKLKKKVAGELAMEGEDVIEATIRTDQSGNLLNKTVNRLLAIMPTSSAVGMSALSQEATDRIDKLPPQFVTGLNYLKNAEPVVFERITEALEKGLPISESQIANITQQGLELETARLQRKLKKEEITPVEYNEKLLQLNTVRKNNVMDNEEVLRAFLSDGAANILDELGKAKQAGSEAGNPTATAINYLTGHTWNYDDAEIKYATEKYAKENGIDPQDSRVQKAIRYLQDNEGAIIMQNSIAKAGGVRELFKGLAEPIRGISSSIEDLGKTSNDVYVESQSQGNVNVSEKRLKAEDTGVRGVVNDVVKGTGQFITQAGLAYLTSGAVGAAGKALSAGEAAAGTQFGNMLLNTKDGIATFVTAYGQSYDNNLKNALNYTSDNALAKRAAAINSAIEGSTELFLSPLDIAKGIASKFRSKGTTEELLTILSDKNLMDNPTKLRDFLTRTMKAAGATAKVAGAEIGEEYVTQIADYVTNSYLNPESTAFQNRDLQSELATTAYETGLSMAIPALLNGVGAANANTFSKGSLLIAAQNRQKLIESLDEDLALDNIDQNEYNEKVSIVNTAAVANENLPLKADGSKLSTDEKADYIFSRTSEAVMKNKIEKSQDEAEKRVLEGKIKTQQDFRTELLGTPTVGQQVISDELATDAAETTTQQNSTPETPIDIINTLEGNDQIPAFELKAMQDNPETALQTIADQALGFGRVDGVRQPLDESAPEPQMDATVRKYGQEVVDKAIAMFPAENVEVTEAVVEQPPAIEKTQSQTIKTKDDEVLQKNSDDSQAIISNEAEGQDNQSDQKEVLSNTTASEQGAVVTPTTPTEVKGNDVGEGLSFEEFEDSIERNKSVKDFRVKKDGKKIGEIMTWEYEDGIKLVNVFINESLRGKGLGKQIYRMANEESVKKTGKPLWSNKETRNENSNRIWESLVKSGEALIENDGTYRFTPKENQQSGKDVVVDESVVDNSTKEPYKGTGKNDAFTGTVSEFGQYGGIEYRSTIGISNRPGSMMEKLPYGKGYTFWNVARVDKGGNFRDLLKKKIDEHGVVYTISDASEIVINAAKKLVKSNPEYVAKEIKSEYGDYFAIGKKSKLEKQSTNKEGKKEEAGIVVQEPKNIPESIPLEESVVSVEAPQNIPEPITIGNEETETVVTNDDNGNEPPINEVNDAEIFVEDNRTILSHRGLQEIATEFELSDVTPRERVRDLEELRDAAETIDKWVEDDSYSKNIQKIIQDAEMGEGLNAQQRLILQQHLSNVRLKTAEIREEKGVESQEYDKALSYLNRVVRAGEKARSTSGAALRIGNISSVGNPTVEDWMVEETELNKNAPLTDGQKETVEKEFTEIAEAEKAYNAKIAELENKDTQKDSAEVVKKTKSNTTKKPKKTHDDYVAERKKIEESIGEKLRKARGELSVTPIPYAKELFAIAPDVTRLMKSYVEEGISKLADIVTNIHKELQAYIPEIKEQDVHDIIAGNYNPKRKTRNEISAAIFDLREEAKLVTKLSNLINGIEPVNEKQKIKRNQEIESLRQKIREFADEKREAANEIKKAQKEEERIIREFEKEQNSAEKARLKAAAEKQKEIIRELERKTAEEIALQAIKIRTANNIKKLEEDLSTGNFDTPPKKESIKLDAEALDLKDKMVKLKMDRQLRIIKQQQQNLSSWEKAQKGFAEILNIPRTLMTILDYSAVLRQGVVQSVSHPSMVLNFGVKDGKIKLGGAAVDMIKAGASQKMYDRWFFDLKESPRFTLMEQSGLGITDSTNPLLSAREEGFMSSLAEKIPIIGQTLKVGNVKIPGTNLVKGSERSYSMFLNKMRVDVFNRFADAMEERGLTFENSPEAYKQMADYVNNSTGRGNVGQKLNKIAPLLNSLFFSPRLIASRLNMLTYLAQPRFYKTVPKEVRQAYFKDMGKFIGLGMTVLGLLSLYDGDDEDEKMTVELDPRSSDFGKVRQGNTRWDIWGGFQQYIRVAAQALSGQRKSANNGKMFDLSGDGPFGKTRGDVILNFTRGKLAPVPAMAIDLFSGRTTLGDKVVMNWGAKEDDKEISIDRYLKEHLIPLTFTGTQEAVKDQGIKAIFTVGVPGIFGVGTQVYKTDKPK